MTTNEDQRAQRVRHTRKPPHTSSAPLFAGRPGGFRDRSAEPLLPGSEIAVTGGDADPELWDAQRRHSLPGQVSAGRFRCRDHPDHPVSWRGTGCSACRHELRYRESRRHDA